MTSHGKLALGRGSIWPWSVAGLTIAGLILLPLLKAWEIAPDLGHGWAAPILMLYLWWERWPMRPPLGAPPQRRMVGRGELLGLGLVVLTLIPIRLLLTPYPVWPGALALYVGSLVCVIALVTHRCFGREGMKWVAGPLWLLPSVMPWPGLFDRLVIMPVRNGIATIIAEMSNVLGAPAMASGTSVRLANGWVGIDEACGGIRSLHAAVMTALFFGEWLKLTSSRRVALVGVGVLAAMGGNLGRVGFLSWCATGPVGTLDRWHDTAGWVALGISLVTTGWIGWRWAHQGFGHPTTSRWVRPPLDQLSPIPRLSLPLITLVVGLVAIEGATRWWYARGSSIESDGLPNWSVQLPVDSPSFVSQQLNDAAQDMLRPDAFVSGSWIGVDGVRRMANYIEWHEGQAARTSPYFHNPTICLPSSGAELIESFGEIRIPWGEGTVPFQSYLFRQMNEELVVAFTIWDPSRDAPLRTPRRDLGWWSWMREQWLDVRQAREHQPAQLLSFAMVGSENRHRLKSELTKLMAKTAGSRPNPAARD